FSRRSLSAVPQSVPKRLKWNGLSALATGINPENRSTLRAALLRNQNRTVCKQLTPCKYMPYRGQIVPLTSADLTSDITLDMDRVVIDWLTHFLRSFQKCPTFLQLWDALSY